MGDTPAAALDEERELNNGRVTDPHGLLPLVLAKRVAGRLPSETLPSIAVDLLTDGVDSPSLRVLAGMHGSNWSEIDDTWTHVLRELRAEPPAAEDAMVILVEHS